MLFVLFVAKSFFMKILIIGGTKFSGRHLVKAALENNHEVTIFHRGNHSADDFGETKDILGDRNFDLEKLEDRTWDAVVDMCGYLPQSLEFMRTASVDKAFSKGLKIRPLHKTVRETSDWRKTLDAPIKAGIFVEREKELLRKWHEQNSE